MKWYEVLVVKAGYGQFSIGEFRTYQEAKIARDAHEELHFEECINGYRDVYIISNEV